MSAARIYVEHKNGGLSGLGLVDPLMLGLTAASGLLNQGQNVQNSFNQTLAQLNQNAADLHAADAVLAAQKSRQTTALVAGGVVLLGALGFLAWKMGKR